MRTGGWSRPALFLGFALAWAGGARSEQPPPPDKPGAVSDFGEYSLDDLLCSEVSVATMQPLDLREAPGIITVISADEITRSGARDLMDVLALVPGFAFGMDVNGVVGLGVRGNWAHEGKVLLLFDGLPMQELSFSTLQFGNHYPLQGVERIEIIRGPGSVIYGGNAELGVINLITKQAGGYNGLSVSGRYGQFDSFQGSDFYQRSAGFSAGQAWGPVSFALHGAYLLGNRSDGTYTDFYGGSFGMIDHNDMSALMINAAFRFRELQLRLLWDRYDARQQDLFGVSLPEPMPQRFDTIHAELTHELKLGGFTLQPKLRATIQYPWHCSSDKARAYDEDPDGAYEGAYTGLYENKRIEAYHAGLVLHHTGVQPLRFLGGLEFDLSRGIAQDPYAAFSEGKESVSYWSTAGFAQLEWQTAPVILTVGARVDLHQEAGWALVPRISLARAFARWHYKLMFSRAFRTPSISNFDKFTPLDPGDTELQPETTSVAELELGTIALKGLSATANLYFIRIADPIVYFYAEDDAYDNFSHTGTLGGELELRYQLRRGMVRATYAYFQAQDNQASQYEVPELGQIKDEEAGYDVLDLDLLGFARHKVTVNGHASLWKGLYAGVAAIWTSERYGYTGVDAEDNLVVGKFDPLLTLNLTVGYDDLLIEGLRLGIAVQDLLDDGATYLQPYHDGYHAPLPGPGREWELFLRYDRAL